MPWHVLEQMIDMEKHVFNKASNLNKAKCSGSFREDNPVFLIDCFATNSCFYRIWLSA